MKTKKERNNLKDNIKIILKGNYHLERAQIDLAYVALQRIQEVLRNEVHKSKIHIKWLLYSAIKKKKF